MKINAPKGFTLIELLLAILIFSVVVTAIYSTFATGIMAWKKGEQNIRSYQDARLIFNKLGLELRNAIIYNNINFIGEATELYFVTRLPSRELENIPVLHQVNYRMDKENLLLKRREENLFAFLQEQERKIRESAFPLKEANFAYAKEHTEKSEFSWEESWINEDFLPCFVKITLIFEDDKNPAGEIGFSRTICLPDLTGS